MTAEALPPHPDRIAPTLAVRAQLLETAGAGPFAEPDRGSDDARVDLKLLAWRTRAVLAARGTEAARNRLRELETPDLLAGTVQDGTARGCAVAYEEAISLCGVEESITPEPDPELEIVTGKDLRRRREFLVASGGSRIRFSRRHGILFVDRKFDVHESNCVWFEDRTDTGTLDGFAPLDHERPRLFSPAFLEPKRYETGKRLTRLTLEGRLGRRGDGFPCHLVIEGDPDEASVSFTIRVSNHHDDHRLRIRILGCRRLDAIDHEGTPGWEVVNSRGRWFAAATIVRACGRLAVGDTVVAVPAAQIHSTIEHRIRLGGRRWA